jgi:hypothetical protein
MGGAVAYLLAIDLLRDYTSIIPHDVVVKVIVFGAPRCGNSRLVEHWLNLKHNWASNRGEGSCVEISVKAHNDG